MTEQEFVDLINQEKFYIKRWTDNTFNQFIKDKDKDNNHYPNLEELHSQVMAILDFHEPKLSDQQLLELNLILPSLVYSQKKVLVEKYLDYYNASKNRYSRLTDYLVATNHTKLDTEEYYKLLELLEIIQPSINE